MASPTGMLQRLSSWLHGLTKTNAKDIDPKKDSQIFWALGGLAVMGFGCLFILAYGFQYATGKAAYLGIVSVGLMSAGAASLSGGLLGFLFGVPHTVPGEPGPTGNSANSAEQQSMGPSTRYRPNTALEQISDWLTKMLVGVGLIEFKGIADKLRHAAEYIAQGIGDKPQAPIFALAILIYFGVSGFLLGYLLARLFLVRWFREADDVYILAQKIDRLENQQQKDAEALALINQQINRKPDEPAATPERVAETIKTASQPVRALIFNLAEKAADDTKAVDYYEKLEAVIPIFEGLIATDSEVRYHRNHSELSYALLRKKQSNPKGAEEEITQAIAIRDKLKKKGWLYYELHLARCLIEQDENFKNALPANNSDLKKRIQDNLKKAYLQTDKLDQWFSAKGAVARWMTQNGISQADLVQL